MIGTVVLTVGLAVFDINEASGLSERQSGFSESLLSQGVIH